MPTDLEIANGATLEPIEAIAWKLGISSTEITPMGKSVAKITWDALKSRFKKPQGSLVLVTSVNPTPFGEGKTVTTIGLTQALCQIGQSATCVIREPSKRQSGKYRHPPNVNKKCMPGKCLQQYVPGPSTRHQGIVCGKDVLDGLHRLCLVLQLRPPV